MRRTMLFTCLFATSALACSLALGCAANTGTTQAASTDEPGMEEAREMDIQLHYEEFGEGEPLILLHGNGGDSSYFTNQIAFFKDAYHVIAIDTRGHGRSPLGTAPFTLDQFADDLYAFMVEHGIERANILGFSDGANIALLFALDHPERVESLVLYGGNLFPEGLTPDTLHEIDETYDRAVANHDDYTAALMKLMIDEPHIDPASLSALDMPVLVIAGDDDMIEEEHTRLIAQSIPNAQLCIVPGSHFVSAENPVAFNDAVATFLASVTA